MLVDSGKELHISCLDRYMRLQRYWWKVVVAKWLVVFEITHAQKPLEQSWYQHSLLCFRKHFCPFPPSFGVSSAPYQPTSSLGSSLPEPWTYSGLLPIVIVVDMMVSVVSTKWVRAKIARIPMFGSSRSCTGFMGPRGRRWACRTMSVRSTIGFGIGDVWRN